MTTEESYQHPTSDTKTEIKQGNKYLNNHVGRVDGDQIVNIVTSPPTKEEFETDPAEEYRLNEDFKLKYASIEKHADHLNAQLKNKQMLIVNCQNNKIITTVKRLLIKHFKAQKSKDLLLTNYYEKIQTMNKLIECLKRQIIKIERSQIIFVYERNNDKSNQITPDFFNSLVEDNNLSDHHRAYLKDNGIYVVYFISSKKADAEIRKKKHNVIPEYYDIPFLPVLLEEYFKGNHELASKTHKEITEQRKNKLWSPESDEYDFHNQVTQYISEDILEEEIKKREESRGNADSDMLALFDDEIKKAVLFTACYFRSIKHSEYDVIVKALLPATAEAKTKNERNEKKTPLQLWTEGKDKYIRECGLTLKREENTDVFDFKRISDRGNLRLVFQEQYSMYTTSAVETLLTSGIAFNVLLKGARDVVSYLCVQQINTEQEEDQLEFINRLLEKLTTGIRTNQHALAAGSFAGNILVLLQKDKKNDYLLSSILEIRFEQLNNVDFFIYILRELGSRSDYNIWDWVRRLLDRPEGDSKQKQSVEKQIESLFNYILKKHNNNPYPILEVIASWMPGENLSLEEIGYSERYSLQFFWGMMQSRAVDVADAGKGIENNVLFSSLDSNEKNQAEHLILIIKPCFHPLLHQLLLSEQSSGQSENLKTAEEYLDYIRYRVVRQMIEFCILLNGKNIRYSAPKAAKIWQSLLSVWCQHLRKHQLGQLFIRITEAYIEYYKDVLASEKNKANKHFTEYEMRYEAANELKRQVTNRV